MRPCPVGKRGRIDAQGSSRGREGGSGETRRAVRSPRRGGEGLERDGETRSRVARSRDTRAGEYDPPENGLQQ